MAAARDDDVAERRREFERTMMEADRMMMQTVQTALSLIGFGFTINTFFNDVAEGRSVGAGRAARLLGIALLVIGLLLLSLGTWTQSRLRRELMRQQIARGANAADWRGLQSRFTPSYISAVLLMMVGLITLGSVLVRWLL